MRTTEAKIVRLCDFHKGKKKVKSVAVCILCEKDVCQSHVITVIPPLPNIDENNATNHDAIKMLLGINAVIVAPVCIECGEKPLTHIILEIIKKHGRERNESGRVSFFRL